MWLHNFKLNIWKKSTRKSWRMHIWQLKMQQILGPSAVPRPPAYREMYLQTKLNEQLKLFISWDKETRNCICQNGQNLSYWNRYFVMYPHKCMFKKIEEKVSWKVGDILVINARASRALRRALDPCPYWLTSLAQLCFTMLAKSQKKCLDPFWPIPGSASGSTPRKDLGPETLERTWDWGIPPGKDLGPETLESTRDWGFPWKGPGTRDLGKNLELGFPVDRLKTLSAIHRAASRWLECSSETVQPDGPIHGYVPMCRSNGIIPGKTLNGRETVSRRLCE